MLRMFDDKVAFDVDQVRAVYFNDGSLNGNTVYAVRCYTVNFYDGTSIYIRGIPFNEPFESLYPEFIAWFHNLGKVDNET